MKQMGFLLAVLLLGACDMRYHDSISGNGQVTEKVITTDSLTRLIVSDRLDLVLIPSDTQKVVLRADENLLEVIETDMIEGTLAVSSQKLIRMAKAKEVLVYGHVPERLELASKASLISRDSLQMEWLDIKLTNRADARLTGHFRNLSISVTGASTAYLKGSSDFLSVYASSAADVFAYDMEAGECDVSASSASDVRIHVLKKAILNASSAADINYRGEPEIIDSRVNSMADVRQVKF